MFEIIEGEGRATLVVNGEVTMQNTLVLFDVLDEWIKKSDTLELNLGGVAEADLTCLQLLCSANRALLKMKKTLIVTGGEFPEAISKVAREAGFDRELGFVGELGCCGEEGHRCMWIMRDEK